MVRLHSKWAPFILSKISTHTHRRFYGCRRRFYGCFLFLLLIILLLCAGLFFLVRGAGAQEAGDDAVPPQPRSILLLIDNSQSMFPQESGRGGSDPNLLRIDAARLFINYLGIEDSRTVHRCGVIFFGTEAQVAVETTALDSVASRTAIFEQIRHPFPMGWTDHAGALTLARTQIEQSGAHSHPVLVMLTDGKPEWEGTPTANEVAAYQEQIRRQVRWLANRGIPLYVILLQNNAAVTDPDIVAVWRPFWQEMVAATSDGGFFLAQAADDLLTIYHNIVADLTGSITAKPVIVTAVPTQGLRRIITVAPELARLTFVISKEQPEQRVTILQPDGTPLTVDLPGVRYADGEREAVWAVDAPNPGEWVVQISGEGTVTVWQDVRPASPTQTPSPFPSQPAITAPPPTSTLMPTTRSPASTAAPSAPPFTATAVLATSTNAALAAKTTRTEGWLWLWALLGALLLVTAGGWWYQTQQPHVSGTLRILAGPGTSDGRNLIDLDEMQQRRVTIGAPEADVALLGATGRVIILPGDEENDVRSMLISGQGDSLLNGYPLHPDQSQQLTDAAIISIDQHRLRYENLRLRSAARADAWRAKTVDSER